MLNVYGSLDWKSKNSVSNVTKAVVEWLSWRVGELVAGLISYRSSERACESVIIC